MSREYLDLVLELRRFDSSADTFEVALLPSPTIGDLEPIRVSLGLADWADALEDLERKRLGDEDLFELGRRIADWMVPEGAIRERVVRAIVDCDLDRGVRLRLLVREPRLAQLPWEYAYLPMHGDEDLMGNFVVLNPQVSLVRHEALDVPYPPLAGRDPTRLRLVAAMAPAEGYPKLRLDREQSVIEDALADFSVDGVSLAWEPFVERATRRALVSRLQHGADFFHFAGHGELYEEDVDETTGDVIAVGRILLSGEVEGGAPTPVPAEQLATMLQQAGVRLAVLGACDSARRDSVSAWSAIAPAIIRAGVPAVVAMQYEILDYQAIAFSEAFYSALAAGLTLDEAVSVGRQGMVGQSPPRVFEWGVPVLYTRSASGVLFPELAAEQKASAEQVRLTINQTVQQLSASGRVVGITLKRGAGALQASVIQRAETVEGTIIGVELN